MKVYKKSSTIMIYHSIGRSYLQYKTLINVLHKSFLTSHLKNDKLEPKSILQNSQVMKSELKYNEQCVCKQYVDPLRSVA